MLLMDWICWVYPQKQSPDIKSDPTALEPCIPTPTRKTGAVVKGIQETLFEKF
jgi:hypothetical protein